MGLACGLGMGACPGPSPFGAGGIAGRAIAPGGPGGPGGPVGPGGPGGPPITDMATVRGEFHSKI